MGNLNTTVSGVADAFAALHAWISGVGAGQLGWTVVDVINAASDIVYSNTDGGTQPASYIRMTASVKGDVLNDPTGLMDNITFRLYRAWNAGTHTGKGEVGMLGPHWLCGPSVGGSYAQNLFTFNPTRNSYLLNSETVDTNFVADNFVTAFNGRGFYFMLSNSTALKYYDIVNNVTSTIGTAPYAMAASMVLTVDSQGKEYLWMLRYGPVSGSTLYRYDVLLDTWTARADPPWGAIVGTSGGNYSCWDGNDYIYLMKGTASPWSLARYSISNNTWTSLATVTTGAWNIGYITNPERERLAYVHAASSGLAEDTIYWYGPESGGTVVMWYRYNVTSNTWTTAPAAGFPSLPANKIGYAGAFFLGYEPLKGTGGVLAMEVGTAGTNAPDQLYFFDIAAGTFSAKVPELIACGGGGPWNSSNTHMLVSTRRCQPGQLRLPTVNATLNLVGVGGPGHLAVVATWVPPGGTAQIQRFVYAGHYDTYMKQDKFTTVGSLTPGVNKSIAVVEDVTGKLAVGDMVELYDPNAEVYPLRKGQAWAPGGGEVCTITAISDANHIVVDQLIGTYASGVYLGQDICNVVIGNDDMFFASMNSEYGYQFSGETDHYHVAPSLGLARYNIVGKRNVSVLSPLQVYNPNSRRPEYNTVGELRSIYTQNMLANPNDTDVVNGRPYFVFAPFLRKRLSDNRGYEIGPMDG